MRARCSWLWPIALASLLFGCAHKVQVVTTPPGATVLVDGVKVGNSPVTFEENPLPGNHQIEARKEGYRPAHVMVERSATNWWWVAGGLTCCAACYPIGCLSGAALANVALCPACVGCLATGSQGAILTIFSAPSLLTVPLVSLGALLGVTPLGLLLLSTESPEVIKLSLHEQ